MPDREVKTVRQLIYYQYAKIIARRAFSSSDGREAKRRNYGFIKKTFRELVRGTKSWSDITREDWQLIEADKKCIYCGAETSIQREHIVPRSLAIKPVCATCDKVQEVHNQIWACARCNSSKGTLGLYAFFRKTNPGQKKFYDLIPPLLEKKYLKTIYYCHECAGTLDEADIDGDGVLTVLDIDSVIRVRA